MLNIFDHYYDLVSKNDMSKKELLDILDHIDKTSSFGSNNTTGFDLYYKMSQSKNADDEVIKRLVEMNQKRMPISSQMNLDYKISDNGSKTLFDELWSIGIPPDFDHPMKFWRSKYTSEKQLEQIYSEQLVVTKNRGVNKQWLQQQRATFFKHPNAPQKILLRNIKQNENLLAMASNPSLVNKPKIFSAVCGKAVVNSFSDKSYFNILEALLKNKHLNWKAVANGINLPKFVDGILSDSPFITKKKMQLILEFCKHDDCPTEIKAALYEFTKDEEFIPSVARDIFYF